MNPKSEPNEMKRPAESPGARAWKIPRRAEARNAKAEVVLHPLRGEALAALSHHPAVPMPRLEGWRERGLHDLEQALQARDPGDPTQPRLD
ncbi:MAG: hypothetical protein H7343_19900 [Undibacterium sp.]|nr:hypothetical protein [Opitutaceae bacterium]